MVAPPASGTPTRRRSTNKARAAASTLTSIAVRGAHTYKLKNIDLDTRWDRWRDTTA